MEFASTVQPYEGELPASNVDFDKDRQTQLFAFGVHFKSGR